MATNKQKISDAFFSIVERLGPTINISPTYNLSDKPELARKLGEAFFDYMVASIYDCDWEGFAASELRGIAALMQDLNLSVICDDPTVNT